MMRVNELSIISKLGAKLKMVNTAKTCRAGEICASSNCIGPKLLVVAKDDNEKIKRKMNKASVLIILMGETSVLTAANRGPVGYLLI